LCRSPWQWLGPPLAALRYIMYFRFYGWCHVWLQWAVWQCVESWTFSLLPQVESDVCECQSTRMSKIKKWLNQYGTEPFEQQELGPASVEGVNSISAQYNRANIIWQWGNYEHLTILVSPTEREGRPPINVQFSHVMLMWSFCSCNLDLELMTLTHRHILDILKTYQSF